jgi:hypothetical protein
MKSFIFCVFTAIACSINLNAAYAEKLIVETCIAQHEPNSDCYQIHVTIIAAATMEPAIFGQKERPG